MQGSIVTVLLQFNHVSNKQIIKAMVCDMILFVERYKESLNLL